MRSKQLRLKVSQVLVSGTYDSSCAVYNRISYLDLDYQGTESLLAIPLSPAPAGEARPR
jgi:hypothetical protein